MSAALPPDLTRVFLHALQVDARIGYYEHEKGRTQPLLIDVDLTIAGEALDADELGRTIDYDLIASHARSLAATHVDLVETFAERLAAACLSHPLALAARIRIEKPQAVAKAIAGVEITRHRR